MCVVYKAFNKVIVKNQYPLFRINDLFDQLSRIKVFGRINLRLGYKKFPLHVLKCLFEKDMSVKNFETTKVPILGAIWM
jgi:hypothetical protein